MKKGFSLIELLVVIAILAVISAIAFASYNPTQKRARDARRRSDLKAVQNAFEQYFTENNKYSTPCSLMASALPAGLPTLDPTGGTYSTVCAASTYCWCASMEVGPGNSKANCDYPGGTTHYCVTNLQ